VRCININIQILITIVVFMVIVLIYFYVRSLWRPSKHEKVIEVSCKITNKKVDEWKSSPTSPTAKDYYVTFDVSGELLEIKLANIKQFNNLSIGEEGTLAYQKKRFTTVFVSFERKSTNDLEH